MFSLFKSLARLATPVDPDRILNRSQVSEILSGAPPPMSVLLIIQQSSVVPSAEDMKLLHSIAQEVANEPELGMVYGMGSGCAVIKREALQKLQALHSGTRPIQTCAQMINALEGCGFEVRKDTRLMLDLLPR